MAYVSVRVSQIDAGEVGRRMSLPRRMRIVSPGCMATGAPLCVATQVDDAKHTRKPALSCLICSLHT